MAEGNQRRHPRRQVRLKACLDTQAGSVEGHIENIGEGGTFFVTDSLETAVSEGERVTMTFQGRDDDLIEVSGVVLRRERYFHEGRVERAFAIRFDGPFGEQLPEADPS